METKMMSWSLRESPKDLVSFKQPNMGIKENGRYFR